MLVVRGWGQTVGGKLRPRWTGWAVWDPGSQGRRQVKKGTSEERSCGIGGWGAATKRGTSQQSSPRD